MVVLVGLADVRGCVSFWYKDLGGYTNPNIGQANQDKHYVFKLHDRLTFYVDEATGYKLKMEIHYTLSDPSFETTNPAGVWVFYSFALINGTTWKFWKMPANDLPNMEYLQGKQTT